MLLYKMSDDEREDVLRVCFELDHAAFPIEIY